MGVDECLLLETHLRGGRERATLGTKGKVVKGACSVVHQEDHLAFRSEGLREHEKAKQPSDEKSSPNMIKKRPCDTEESSVRF